MVEIAQRLPYTTLMSEEISEEVRQFLSRIGKKGGKAGAGTELRRKANRRAAFIRWHVKKIPNPKKYRKRVTKEI
jgi:hypothetical protein